MSSPSTQYAFVRGRFVQDERARVSIKERGFRFGDGIFDTIRIAHGLPYQWEFHLQRMEKGLQALHIPARLNRLESQAHKLLERNHVTEGILRISISRGIGSKGYLPTQDKPDPTIVMETQALPDVPKEPVKLFISSVRKPSPDALPIQYKLMQGVNSTLARLEAETHACFDAIQFSASGQLAETSSATLFWLRDYVLYTPSISAGALEGSVRHALLRFSPYKVTTGNYPLSELEKADEVFISNAAWGIVPVGHIVPQGWSWSPGPATLRLQHMLTEDRAAYVDTHG